MLLPCNVMAQSARKVLDAAAGRLTGEGGVVAQFKATAFTGTVPQEEVTGTLRMNGARFHMQTAQMQAWFDGTTEWTLLTDTREVNIAEPTEEELAAINPTTLIGIYKKGYAASISSATLRGRATHVVHLIAKRKDMPFTEIYVDVDKGTNDPLCIRAKRDGNWLRLSLLSIQTRQDLPASAFTFPANDFPGVEVIDLR